MSQEKYSCIAIDDDPLFLSEIEAFIEEIPWLELIDKFTNPVQAATSIVNNKPQLLLLDIEMPYIDGYEMLDWIQPKLDKIDPRPLVVVISGRRDLLFHYGEPDVLCTIFKSEMKEPTFLADVIQNALDNRAPSS